MRLDDTYDDKLFFIVLLLAIFNLNIWAYFAFTWSQIAKQVPDAALSIEREGHTHAFCCTEAGSLWVAEHVASLIKNKVSL